MSIGTVTATTAVVTWTPVAGATAYVVEMAPGPGPTWTYATGGANPTVANITMATLTTATTYRVRVAAIVGGRKSDWAPYVVFTTP